MNNPRLLRQRSVQRWPILEERLDAMGALREPRAAIVPGLRLPSGLGDYDLIDLECPACGCRDQWIFWPVRALIVCRCNIVEG